MITLFLSASKGAEEPTTTGNRHPLLYVAAFSMPSSSLSTDTSHAAQPSSSGTYSSLENLLMVLKPTYVLKSSWKAVAASTVPNSACAAFTAAT